MQQSQTVPRWDGRESLSCELWRAGQPCQFLLWRELLPREENPEIETALDRSPLQMLPWMLCEGHLLLGCTGWELSSVPALLVAGPCSLRGICDREPWALLGTSPAKKGCCTVLLKDSLFLLLHCGSCCITDICRDGLPGFNFVAPNWQNIFAKNKR